MTVRAEALGYRYPGAPVAALAGVTLDVPAGQRVVITGFDGAGQTTLLRVLAGLYHDFTGGLSYDGLPARSLDLPALRSEIGQLLSASDLFDGTVAENMRG
jgi:ABC-type bacteriocin/lantibiotic exporter with double-glycine peptidase domain